MNSLLQINMLLFAFIFLFFVVRAINKNIFLLKNVLLWIAVAAAIVLLAIFPAISKSLASWMGFEKTSNFLLFCGIVFLLIVNIQNTKIISDEQQKTIGLIQEVSILKSKKER